MDLGQGPQPQLGNPWLTYLGNMLPDRPWDYYTGPHLAQGIRNIGTMAGYAAEPIMSLLPGSGEAISARDSAEAAARAGEAYSAGDYGRALSSGVESFTAGLGAVPLVGLAVRGARGAGAPLAELAKQFATGTRHAADDMADYYQFVKRLWPHVPEETRPIFNVGHLDDKLLRRIQGVVEPPEVAARFWAAPRDVDADFRLIRHLMLRRENPELAKEIIHDLNKLTTRPDFVFKNYNKDELERPLLVSRQRDQKSGKSNVVVLDIDPRTGMIGIPSAFDRENWHFGIR